MMGRILITGAQGQLGSALTKLLMNNKMHTVYYTSRTASEDGRIKILDITDKDKVNDIIHEIKPDIIINCAAMTAVDLCESEQEMAYQINALGPKHLALAAEKMGAKLIHISTDYVFDGESSRPYIESDQPTPLSVYGKTKLAGEEFVQQYCSRYFILRTAWVYGEGKNFVKTMLRLADSGKAIRVVSDQFGTPTSALELARAILFLINTESYGIYHATCEGTCSWYEFAKRIFKEAGKEIEVEPIPTWEYPTPAKRPKYSVLDNKALREKHGYYMKDWKEAFHEYMEDLLL